MQFHEFENVHAMVAATVDRCGGQPAYRTIGDDLELHTVSWNEFAAAVRRVAKSLIALEVDHGDKAAILSYSNYRWVLTDVALATIGSCAVGIYHSLLERDVEYIVNHSDSVLVFAENADQVQKLVAIRDRVPHVRRVISFGPVSGSDPWIIGFEEFLELGDSIEDDELDRRIAAVTPDDVATIVYTSGTTGTPKGAVLTHDNLTFTAQSVWAAGEIRDGDETLLFLPLAHVFARTCVFTAIVSGTTTTFARGIDTLAEDFTIARPHWFPSVPRVYEKIHTKIIAGAQAKGGLALKIFNWALTTGLEVSDHKVAKQPLPALLRLRSAIADRLVFSKVQAAFGGRVRWCISGAAPLNPEIGRFFHAGGVLILEGIGMTENTSFTNINRFDDYRFGWVGPTGPGIEQRIGDDGEVLYRGRNIMREYYKMPAETTDTLTPDGWQHSGDLGEIDDAGFLRITGRKKDLIITAGGKNIAPSAIEGAIATSKYVSQVCVIGDRRKFLTALVTIDAENVSAWAEEHGVEVGDHEALSDEPRIRELMASVIEAKNRDLASFETIKDFRIVDEFSIDDGLLTPTLKVKRSAAMERYAELIEEMYRE